MSSYHCTVWWCQCCVGSLSWLSGLVALLCTCVLLFIPIQKPGQRWKSLPVSPGHFWKAFYTTFANKDKIITEMRVLKCYIVSCERVTLSNGLGSAATWTSCVVYGRGSFLTVFSKASLRIGVTKGLLKSYTLGMALPAQSEGLAAHEEIILPFSRIWSEAALESLCCEAILSTIHAGNGNSKCSTLTLRSNPQIPPPPLLLHSSAPHPLSV